jgi:hypothetical protein
MTVEGAMVRVRCVTRHEDPEAADGTGFEEFGPTAGSGRIAALAALARLDAELEERSALAFTGRDGSFTLEAVRPGYYRVEVLAPADSGLADRGPEFLAVHADVERELSFDLGPGSTVRGLVMDEKGLPVFDAVVRTATRETTTDESGAFRLHGVAGDRPIEVLAEGHPPLVSGGKILAGDILRLACGKSLALAITSAGGLPVARPRATVCWIQGGSVHTVAGRSRPGGMPLLAGLPEEGTLHVEVEAAGHRPATLLLDAAALETEAIRPVVLAPAVTRELRLVDESGRPRPEVRISGLEVPGVITAADGTAALRVPAGRTPGLVARLDRLLACRLEIPPRRSDGVPDLELSSRDGERVLEVVDAAGQPPRDIWALWILADGGTGQWLDVAVLEQPVAGRFYLPFLGEGLGVADVEGLHVKLVFGGAGRKVQTVIDEEGQERVELPWQRLGSP